MARAKKEAPAQTNKDRLKFWHGEKQRLDREIDEVLSQPGNEPIRELVKSQRAVMSEIYGLLSNWQDIDKPRKV